MGSPVDVDQYYVRQIDWNDSMARWQALQLRSRVFGSELGWVATEREECGDQYDKHALHLGVYRSGIPCDIGLRGYVRVLTPEGCGFMLDSCFAALVPQEEDRLWHRHPEHSLEITRLAVLADERCHRDQWGYSIADHLYKALYRWAQQTSRSLWYIVTEMHYLRVLQHYGFPFEAIGRPYEFQPDVLTTASLMNLRRAEIVLARRNAALYRWITQDRHDD